jgi:antitoxin CptB
MGEHGRLRWRCRRGMLELDLVLSRFADSALERLSQSQRESLQRLLELPDNDLWDMVTGKSQAPDPGSAEVLEYLRRS